MNIAWLFKILIILLLLNGCASRRTNAPIVEAQAQPSKGTAVHLVRAGETLYSIALRYDLDYKKLSIINGISYPYAIHPGQKLALKGTVSRLANSSPQKVPSTTSSTKQKSSKFKTEPKANPKPKNQSARRIRWVWPINGKVLEKFNPHAGLNKGIDIRGKLRESVVAAADGLVVYSGSGLRGYGKLIIVKHSEDYLSAYAHNDQIFVQEGDLVRAGQKIANLGGDVSNTPKLHFEIRSKGEPVDPLQYLPRQSS